MEKSKRTTLFSISIITQGEEMIYDFEIKHYIHRGKVKTEIIPWSKMFGRPVPKKAIWLEDETDWYDFVAAVAQMQQWLEEHGWGGVK